MTSMVALPPARTAPDSNPGLSPMNRFNFSGNGNGRPNSNFTGFDSGHFQNNMDDNSTAPILLGVGGGLLFLSTVLLIARLWSRLRPVRGLHIDDWTVSAATILAIANYAFTSAAVVHGLGRRSRFVSFSRRRTALELIFVGQVLWYWSITLVKISVACLLLRIKHTRPWRMFLHVTMALLFLACIVQTVFQFTQCRPFSVYWDPRQFRDGTVRCFSREVINGNIVAFSSLQVGTDLIFSFIPITFIRKLNRPRREKIFMCILMGLGLFASCAAIIRTLLLQDFYTSRDLFRTNVAITMWATVEQQFAVIAATLPTLKAFLEKTLMRISLFFYDENTETQVRNKLVRFGLVSEDEPIERLTKTITSTTVTRTAGALDSPRADRKLRDEFADLDVVADIEHDKDFEKTIRTSAV